MITTPTRSNRMMRSSTSSAKRSRSAPSKHANLLLVDTEEHNSAHTTPLKSVHHTSEIQPNRKPSTQHSYQHQEQDLVNEHFATVSNGSGGYKLDRERRRLKRQELLREVESDEDLVKRIHNELDKVYQAVESGRTPPPDIWKEKLERMTSQQKEQMGKSREGSVSIHQKLIEQEEQAPKGQLTAREYQIKVNKLTTS